MAKDGSDNLGKNINRSQFGLSDPRSFGFSRVAEREEVSALHPVNHSVIRRVSLSRPMVATQDYVDPEKVKRFTSSPPKRKEPPWLVTDGGEAFVWDGHHSIPAARRRGQKTMRMRVSERLT